MDNQHYLLAFNRIRSIGPIRISQFLTRWPDLSEFFQLSPRAMRAAGISEEMTTAISNFDFARVEEDLHWQNSASNRRIVTYLDDNYPPLLKEIVNPPPVLYTIGTLQAWSMPTVGVIGTRKPSMYGRETAERFAYELARKGVRVISGLALGIDACAHSGCLRAQGLTAAVLGTGINRIYPYAHRYLADKIAESGLLISEFPLNSGPIAGHFPQRNRIISGLSLIILVVEATTRSGSLITARLALEQNRDVMAIPGSLYNAESRGCHVLLQQGAKLVTSPGDVLEELPAHYLEEFNQCDNVEAATWKLPKNHHRMDLTPMAKHLMTCIEPQVTSVDRIVTRSGFVIEKVLCLLAELEAQGIVRAVPGGYMRCML